MQGESAAHPRTVWLEERKRTIEEEVEAEWCKWAGAGVGADRTHRDGDGAAATARQ
jgi:hypothetical protein